MIEFHLDGVWLVSELAQLTEAVTRIYNALLIADVAAPAILFRLLEESRRSAARQRVAPQATEGRVEGGIMGGWYSERGKYPQTSFLQPHSGGGTESPSFPTVQLVRDNLGVLAPEAQLRIKRIEMASPGIVSLEGVGEPIKETGNLIEKLTLLNQKRKEAKLRNDRLRLDLTKQEAQDEIDIERSQVALELDELALARERLQLIEAVFRLRFGDNFREVEGVDRLMQDVISGVKEIDELVAPSRPALPPGERAA